MIQRLDRRRLLAVFLAGLLVATAGCSALDDARSTRTPFDVNDAEYTAREAVRNGSIVAFDAANDHVPRPSVLAEAHTNTLENTSYTAYMERRVRTENGSLYRAVDHRLVADPTAGRFNYSVTANYHDRPETSLTRYGNGTHVISHVTGPDTDRYGIEPMDSAIRERYLARIVTGPIQRTLYATNVTNVERASDDQYDVDGAVYVVHADAPSNPESDLRNVSVEIVVTDAGRVLSFVFDGTRETTDGVFHVSTEITVTDVGASTVSSPPWIDEARANSSTATTGNATTRTTGRSADRTVRCTLRDSDRIQRSRASDRILPSPS